MVRTICVSPNDVCAIWPHVSHWILAAFENNDSDDTFEKVQAEVLAGHALLWMAVGLLPQAAAISKVWTIGQKKICTVLAVGGSGERWSDLLKPIEEYAAAEGCTTVRLEGRPGWARVFKDYTQPWIVLEKKVN